MGNRVSDGYISTTPIVLEIDMFHIEKGIANLERLGHLLEQAEENGKQELLIGLEDKLREYLDSYGLGSLKSSIIVTDHGDGVSISVGADYAVYLEYGTGIVGANSPHPSPFMDWQYDVNNHGMKGWWYPTTEADPNRHKVVTKSGELIAFTRGVPSRPFMYMTWLWGRRMATRIIRKHIRRALEQVGGV